MVDEDHAIHWLGDDIDIYREQDGDVLAEVDFDEEAGLPVFGLASEDESYIVFLTPASEYIRVLNMRIAEKGDFKRLMDLVVATYGLRGVQFVDVRDRSPIEEVASNVSSETVQVDEQPVVLTECVWPDPSDE